MRHFLSHGPRPRNMDTIKLLAAMHSTMQLVALRQSIAQTLNPKPQTA